MWVCVIGAYSLALSSYYTYVADPSCTAAVPGLRSSGRGLLPAAVGPPFFEALRFSLLANVYSAPKGTPIGD